MEEFIQYIPVQHLSFSAVRTYLSDARSFKKKYIDHIWDDKTPIAMAEGSAYHAALEYYWQKRIDGTLPKDDSQIITDMKAVAINYLEADYDKILWGERRIAKKDIENYPESDIVEKKSGNRTNYYVEESPGVLVMALEERLVAYLNDVPEFLPEMVEDSLVVITKDFNTGEDIPVPMKARFDLVGRDNDKKLVIIDHKLMRTAPSRDKDDNYVVEPSWRLQAACYDAMWFAQTGKRPDYFIFDVMPKTGEAQLHRVRIEIEDRDRIAWSRLLNGAIIQMALGAAYTDPDVLYLPNPFSGYDQDGWNDFMQDIDADLLFEHEEMMTNSAKDAEYEAVDL